MADDTLHIAEVLFESGAVNHRYSRRLSADGSRWVREGLFCSYSESGAIASEGMYENGLEAGEWRDFYANGVVAAQGTYVNGKEHGVWQFWSEDGESQGETVYDHGQVVAERRTL